MTVYRDKMNQVSFTVQDFEFETLDGGSFEECKQPREYNLKEFPIDNHKLEQHEKIIKKERVKASENHFRVAPVVLEHRGLLKQEQQEKELQIRDEVDKRLELMKEQAYQEGLAMGREDGRKEVFEQTKKEVEEKVQAVAEMVSEVLNTQQELLENYKKDIYFTVKNLAKWVTLKELERDDHYLERLLEKLVLEINSRSNLLIKIGPDSLKRMDDVLDVVQGKLGKLQNLRVEIDQSLGSLGMIVESDNGIINASFDQQMKAIDELFESVGGSHEQSS